MLIGIYDPFGLPAGFYFGTINSDLEFSTNFLVKSGVNFRTEGTYSIKNGNIMENLKQHHFLIIMKTFQTQQLKTFQKQQLKTFQKQQLKTFQKTTTENIPETTTENIPETTTENIPETTTENIPETTTENIPETTYKPIIDKESSKPNSSTKSEITEIFLLTQISIR